MEYWDFRSWIVVSRVMFGRVVVSLLPRMGFRVAVIVFALASWVDVGPVRVGKGWDWRGRTN